VLGARGAKKTRGMAFGLAVVLVEVRYARVGVVTIANKLKKRYDTIPTVNIPYQEHERMIYHEIRKSIRYRRFRKIVKMSLSRSSLTYEI
jgi:hypothetical protein